jgi:ABC-type Fe3+ transport system permease subunit
MATFLRELRLYVVLSRRETEVLAVQILRLPNDGLWKRLSAPGLIMIVISTSSVRESARDSFPFASPACPPVMALQ